jgi:Mn-dependent DtxR family transcriptional regulator
VKRFWVNTDLVNNFLVEDEMGALAIYYKIKTHFSNSTIFKPTNSKLEKLFGVSRPTLKKYLHILENKGLLVCLYGNLTAVSYKKSEIKPTRRNSVSLWINEKDTVSTIVSKMKYSIFKKAASKQLFMIGLKSLLDQEKAKINLTHYKKYVRGRYGEKGMIVNQQLCMSTEKIATLLNCSPQSVSRIKKQWEELNLVKFTRSFKVIGFVPKGKFRAVKDSLPKGAFVAGNGIIRQSQPSTFEILDQKKLFKVKYGVNGVTSQLN